MPPRRRKRWHPVLPKDFLCCLSLQAGVVGCSVVGLTLMFITTLVNIYDRNNETAGIQATQYCLLFLYLIIMYAGFTMSFLAAFWEISKLLRLAGYFIFFGLALYIIYVIISIIPSYRTMINVCPGMRCPDHHWLNVDHWRRYILADELEERWKPTTTKAPTRYAQLKYPKIIYPEGEPNAPINLSSENSSDVLSLSFPRRVKRDETPTTQKEDEKPTTQKEDEKPTTQKEDETPTTQKQDETPTTQKQDEKPTTQKQDETPTTQKQDEKPTTQKEDEKPTTQKEVETPFTEGSTSTLEWNSTTNETTVTDSGDDNTTSHKGSLPTPTTVTDSGDDNTTSHKGSVPTPTHYHPHGPGPVKTPSPHDDHTDDLPDTKKKKKKKKEGNVVFMILSVIFALFFVGFLGYSIITFVALANLYDSRYD